MNNSEIILRDLRHLGDLRALNLAPTPVCAPAAAQDTPLAPPTTAAKAPPSAPAEANQNEVPSTTPVQAPAQVLAQDAAERRGICSL